MLVLPLNEVVQACAPVGTAGSGDGRGAVMALEAKYRFDGESGMQEQHGQVASLQVTEAERYDPARVIRELRRICVDLGALGDILVVVAARKTHAFFRALQQRDGTASNFEDMAARGTCYHVILSIRDKPPLRKKVRDETNMMQAVASVR